MYAIVEIAGQQFKVEKSQKIFVHRLNNDEGSKLNFDKVLLIDNDKDVIVGEPIIKNASIKAKVITHLKGDKVKVFKKKRRKGYKVLNGHRQFFTEILIEDILEKGSTKKETPAKEEKPEKVATKAKVKETPVKEEKPEKVVSKAKVKETPKAEVKAKAKPATKPVVKKVAKSSDAKPKAKKAKPEEKK